MEGEAVGSGRDETEDVRHLRELGSRISVPIQADEDGFTGRECPNAECEGYFKIVSGTGLEGNGLSCHCPYCGHTADHDEFWTQEQIRYAESVAMRQISDAIRKDLKSLEFEHKPRGLLGIGWSMKVKAGRPLPIHQYREKKLETTIVCGHCTLRYAVYGVFAFCPDCRQHNSQQILGANLEVVRKVLDLAESHEGELREKLIENALEDCVSAFDAFGKELCRVHADRTSNPATMNRMRFQNLVRARAELQAIGVEMTAAITTSTWERTLMLFQKRHLIAHRLGVADQEYVDRSGDSDAVLGRKVRVGRNEVTELGEVLWTVAESLTAQFAELATVT